MAKLLTIETGFSCNSRCNYCTQLDFRAIPQPDRLDLPTADLLARIEWAARNGYDQIGFSGGEPTIRPDFLQLVSHAKGLDFERIGVTTNGRMFAYPRFAEAAVAAGLDAWTFSLHGPTPDVHDRITASPGALEQGLAGLQNVAAVCARRGVRAHLMNNQILLPTNTRHIADLVELLAPLGVRLFMVQPFIAQRSNVADLGRFFVPYAEVVQAVRAALPALQRYGARIKPYNVPNCLLWPLGREHVESQFYGITVYREFERETAGEFKAFRARQWYRVDDCKTCKEMCPGFRIEQYPQARMVDELRAAAEGFAAQNPRQPGDGPLLVPGTELLDAASLAHALGDLGGRHGPLGWMTAAMERTDRQTMAQTASDLASQGLLAELVLVAQPADQRFLAQRVVEKGSFEAIAHLLRHLATLRQAGRPLPLLRLLINVGDALRIESDGEVAAQWRTLLAALDEARGDGPADVVFAIPNYPRGKAPPEVERQSTEHRAWAQQLCVLADRARLRPVLATLEDRRGLDSDRARAMALAEAEFAKVLPVESWARRLFRPPLASADMDFVSWMPPWLFERWDLAHAALPAEAVPRSYADAPDEEAFSALRKVSVARTAGLRIGAGRFGGARRPAPPTD
ncbi:MAG: radical SAM protein [Deltaproteobacteria bacterium]|nr:radical SAM protein [Deltaproteobacteria bacterium]